MSGQPPEIVADILQEKVNRARALLVGEIDDPHTADAAKLGELAELLDLKVIYDDGCPCRAVIRIEAPQ